MQILKAGVFYFADVLVVHETLQSLRTNLIFAPVGNIRLNMLSGDKQAALVSF
jgi:hypothetical protein